MLHRMHMDNVTYKDTHVQTMAVVAAGKDGRLRDAMAVYNLMLQDGVRPNAPTFNARAWPGRGWQGCTGWGVLGCGPFMDGLC
jgi:pentatricopeptide repeat protein